MFLFIAYTLTHSIIGFDCTLRQPLFHKTQFRKQNSLPEFVCVYTKQRNQKQVQRLYKSIVRKCITYYSTFHRMRQERSNCFYTLTLTHPSIHSQHSSVHSLMTIALYWFIIIFIIRNIQYTVSINLSAVLRGVCLCAVAVYVYARSIPSVACEIGLLNELNVVKRSKTGSMYAMCASHIILLFSFHISQLQHMEM